MKQIDITDFLPEPEEQSSGFGMAEKQLEQAKQAGLKYVASRMRTSREVQEYLQKKNISREMIREVVAFLEEYRYLDDAAYCKSWIHDRVQFHPCGRQKMAVELAKKISDKTLIRTSLEAYFSEETELETALEAALKKTGGSRAAVSREKLGRFLYTKGFSGAIINQVLQDERIQERVQTEYNNF